jgi:hypothetical protein
MQLSLGSDIVALDDSVLLWVNQFVARSPLFDKTVLWLLNANIFKFGPLVMAICWYWFEANQTKPRLESSWSRLLQLALSR